jgi:hypothetical protein
LVRYSRACVSYQKVFDRWDMFCYSNKICDQILNLNSTTGDTSEAGFVVTSVEPEFSLSFKSGPCSSIFNSLCGVFCRPSFVFKDCLSLFLVFVFSTCDLWLLVITLDSSNPFKGSRYQFGIFLCLLKVSIWL